MPGVPMLPMVAICTEVVLVLPTEDVLNQLRLSVTRFFSCSERDGVYQQHELGAKDEDSSDHIL